MTKLLKLGMLKAMSNNTEKKKCSYLSFYELPQSAT